MQTLEETYIDKKSWTEGEWKTEPDKKQWQDEETGLPCLIVRAEGLGQLCGYVGVTEKHPLFKVTYSDFQGHEFDVHGGITYSALCSGPICHVTEPEENDHVWWIGFDCAHSFDFAPKLFPNFPKFSLMQSQNYRNFRYVEQEVTKLAEQLFALM